MVTFIWHTAEFGVSSFRIQSSIQRTVASVATGTLSHLCRFETDKGATERFQILIANWFSQFSNSRAADLEDISSMREN